VKPFLFLGIRPEDIAADEEYGAILRCGGLEASELQRMRLEQRPLGQIDLDDWSGIILGGGPFQVSDPEEGKSAVQRRVESDLAALLDDIVQRDFPFLGCCYGIGTLGRHAGAVVDGTYKETIGGSWIRLTDAGRADPLFNSAGPAFGAYLGHKEAITKLPEQAVALATSDACPVQAFRVKSNVYATQFHPELDLDGLITRVRIYKYAGYFEPDQADATIEAARNFGIIDTPPVLARFVELYRR
jgi:GMP synthase (glutamine-hydrolysing)